MRTPRDVSGLEFAKALRVLGYERVRQDGSHIRVTTQQSGEHHATIPNHRSLKMGTFRTLLRQVAVHHNLSLDELMQKLDL